MDSSELTLRDIADRAVARNGGKGGRALGRAAEKRGLTLSYTTVDKIRAGTYMSTPSAKTLEALAELSGEPLRVVYAAAGLPMPRGSFADNLPPDADLLEPEQRKLVYDVVRVLARQNKELHRLRGELDEQKAGGEHDQRSASMNQAGTQPAHHQTRETTPASTASERLTEDESNVHTAAGEGDHGESSKLERLRQLRSEARSFTATGAPASAASADEPVDEEEEERVARAREAERARREHLERERDATPPPPGLVADLPNGVAAFLGRDALRDLGIDTREPESDLAPPLDAAARDVGTPSRGQQLRELHDEDAERPDEETP